jgi:glycosyltransferase involved in cell wall biosynthesis
VRIGIVASPVTPLRAAQLGGAQAFIADLAAGLTRRGHAVILHCAEGSEVPGVRLVTVPAPVDAGAALVMPGGAPPLAAPGVAAALRTMFDMIASEHVDVISQHAFDGPAFDLSRGHPVLHTLHLPPLVPAVVAAVGRMEPATLATVSRASRSAWAGAGIDVPHVLRNGVAEVPIPDGGVDEAALVAGRISREKGIEDAIAAASAAGLPVRLAGAHYDPAYAVDLSGTDRLGPLARDDLRRVMARSAVTICAVRWEEPFGMVAAEAQMAGCPVAAYRRGAMPEVVEDGVSGFLAQPDDVSALSAAIRRCLSLDRSVVRASARRRLGLEAALDGYEAALAQASR